jgi:hypothetical protein
LDWDRFLNFHQPFQQFEVVARTNQGQKEIASARCSPSTFSRRRETSLESALVTGALCRVLLERVQAARLERGFSNSGKRRPNASDAGSGFLRDPWPTFKVAARR